MTSFILATKVGMTQIFSQDGAVIPVTVLEVAPQIVTQVKSSDKDGYKAVQVGTKTKKHLSKALTGHLKDLGNLRFLREFRVPEDFSMNRGDTLDLNTFAPGDKVKVTGISKGKGFAGAMKRHGFHGMPSSHGHKAVKRHIGSIGQRFPQHTLKGKRMAGHMGHENVSVRGLKVAQIDTEHGLMAVTGAVPGNRGGLVVVVKI
jgi:large subunit ribosomal protein L3